MSVIQPGRPHRVPVWGSLLAAGLLVELVCFSVLNTNFFGGGTGMLSQIEIFIPTGLLALGETFVILAGNIDLSAGAVASLSSVVVGLLLVAHVNTLIAVVLAILVGTVVGLINGAFITLLGINSLLVTLATEFIASTIAVSVAGNNPPYNFPMAFANFGQGTIGPFPILLLAFAAIAVLAVAGARTHLGRKVVLMGYSLSASRYSGINTRRTLLAIFTMSGTVAGISGVFLAAFYDAGRPDSGIDLLLPAVTCVVLGGVDIFGGKGRVGEVVVAVFLVGYLTQGLLDLGISSLAVTMLTGALLIAALTLKRFAEREPRWTPGVRTRRGAAPRALVE